MSKESALRPGHGPWFLHPYLQIGWGALLATTSELLLKQGATATKALAESSGWHGISALASGWVWAGILTYIAAFVSWLHVLRFVPLHIAFALMSVVQILVPLGAWAFLHETLSPLQCAGIFLVVCGIAVIAKPLMDAEERL